MAPAFAIPAFLILVPVALVIKQPDLGTAIMMALSGLVVFFIAGVGCGSLYCCFWGDCSSAYHLAISSGISKKAYFILSPEIDPLGAGYHLMQSKIA